MTQEILLFVGGVGVLYVGAEWRVRGSARLAAYLQHCGRTGSYVDHLATELQR